MLHHASIYLFLIPVYLTLTWLKLEDFKYPSFQQSHKTINLVQNFSLNQSGNNCKKSIQKFGLQSKKRKEFCRIGSKDKEWRQNIWLFLYKTRKSICCCPGMLNVYTKSSIFNRITALIFITHFFLVFIILVQKFGLNESESYSDEPGKWHIAHLLVNIILNGGGAPRRSPFPYEFKKEKIQNLLNDKRNSKIDIIWLG
ncbi:hypothetical protein BpHYR1_010837 [Brachionus plicatilis]|uniref:Uncharacterized protein n=1 Tax=Brachionus plicatilis TaxID=10195 RepID=A0A3M7RW53_BRAPC|nr:hypothetical protein BpHYR1_010837 [Brachionus plicatilis]